MNSEILLAVGGGIGVIVSALATIANSYIKNKGDISLRVINETFDEKEEQTKRITELQVALNEEREKRHQIEVSNLKLEVEKLKAEIERLKEEVNTLKLENKKIREGNK